jgi:hypothetical protein
MVAPRDEEHAVTVKRIQFRRGTASEWTAANPVLASGEPGFEEDTGKTKVGNGVSPWDVLPYQNAAVPGGGTGGDTSAPSTPGNVRKGVVRATSARVDWDASTDNMAVTGYEVTVNGAVQAGPVTTLYTELSDLTPETNYTVSVRARDAVGNWSAPSAPIVILTLAEPSMGHPDASNQAYVDSTGVLHYFANYPIDGDESTQVLLPYSGVLYTTADDQIIENMNIDGGTIVVRHTGV